jgi:hypothetical protein
VVRAPVAVLVFAAAAAWAGGVAARRRRLRVAADEAEGWIVTMLRHGGRISAARGNSRVDGTLNLAASAFVPKYLEVRRNLDEVDNTSKLSAAFHASLTSIDQSLGHRSTASQTVAHTASDVAAVRKVLNETMRRIEESIPGWLRDQEVNAKWNQEKLKKANELVRQAAEKGWHPYALTTAAEVAAKVAAADETLGALRELVRQPNPQIVTYLANIEHMLDQLRQQVAALQTQHETTAAVSPEPMVQKKAKSRAPKSSS